MLRLGGLFAAAFAVLGCALTSGTVQAKTTLVLEPNAGRGATAVRATGDGFCPGEVSLALALSDPIDAGASAGMFLADPSQLPRSLHLASVAVRDGVFETTLTIPTEEDVASYFGKRPHVVYILAVQPGHEGCSSDR